MATKNAIFFFLSFFPSSTFLIEGVLLSKNLFREISFLILALLLCEKVVMEKRKEVEVEEKNVEDSGPLSSYQSTA